MLMTLDYNLALCPKNEGAKRVLDLGTGTGKLNEAFQKQGLET